MFFCNSRRQEKQGSATAVFAGREPALVEGSEVLSRNTYVNSLFQWLGAYFSANILLWKISKYSQVERILHWTPKILPPRFSR